MPQSFTVSLYGIINIKMTTKRLWSIAINLLILQAITGTAALYAAQPCIGLDCRINEKVDGRQTRSKKVPVRVSLNDVLTQPNEFDGINIHITGQIISIEQRTSRHGHFYWMFTLSNVNASPENPGATIRIFAFISPRVRTGDTIEVEGTYRMDYWFGGWPFENFINAEVIKRGSVL